MPEHRLTQLAVQKQDAASGWLDLEAIEKEIAIRESAKKVVADGDLYGVSNIPDEVLGWLLATRKEQPSRSEDGLAEPPVMTPQLRGSQD